MAENIGDLSITIRVNRQTGELDILKGQVVDTGKAVEGLGQSSAGSSEQLTGFASSIARLASATAVLVFLREAISEAAAEQEALRQLKAQMDALGLSFDINRVRIEQWTEAMAAAAHIEDDVVIGALGRTIQRTKDLDQAMKLVQLSQDISIATGKNFESTLDMLSRAAGGAQRGLMMLRQEFGTQLVGVTSNQEALNRLGATYGGAATTAKSAALSFGDMWRQLKEGGESVVKGVLPAFQGLVDVLGGPVMIVIKTVAVGTGQLIAQILQEVTSAAGGIRRLVEGVVEIVFNLFTGRLRAAKDSATQLGKDLVQLVKDDIARQGELMAEGDRKLKEIWTGQKDAAKQNLVEVSNFRAAETEKETQQELEQMNRRIDELRRQEAIELADKMLTSDEKIAILESYAQREIEIVTETKQKIGEEETKAAEKIAAINDAVALKKKQLEQEGLTNWRQGVTEWGRHIVDTNARVAEVGKSTFDGLANSFGQATAKMLMSGKGFAQTFESLFKNLASQVISQLTAMLVKAAVLNTITGGTGSAFGIKFFAEGGRVYNPTYALIGEGGEPESVVPDSKAQDFARGVLAGKGSGSRSTASAMPVAVRQESQGAGGAKRSVVASAETAGGRQAAAPAQGITVNMGGISDITINVNGNAGVNGGNVSDLASAIVQGLSTESAKYIELALTLDNVAERYRGRAV